MHVRGNGGRPVDQSKHALYNFVVIKTDASVDKFPGVTNNVLSHGAVL